MGLTESGRGIRSQVFQHGGEKEGNRLGESSQKEAKELA